MKKVLLTLVLATTANLLSAQVYNNEWIDYSKTYYKFKVGATGLYHIAQQVLASAGLGSTPAQNFQLWRNGQEVAIYTTVTSGAMSSSDFIEFYGEMNDGKPDKTLYKNDTLQVCDKWSILTDTASYFLTVNSSGSNKRFINTANNVTGNLLSAETYFIHKIGKYYKDVQNQGYGIDFGEVVHSSAFENAEGWTSSDFYSNGSLSDYNSNLYLYPSGPPASMKAAAAGNYTDSRNISFNINGTLLATNFTNGYEVTKFNVTSIPLSTFTGDQANVQFTHNGSAYDHVVVSYYELSYPRQYNFGGQSQFYFELPASSAKYLTINNFNYGSTAPVLFDITNNLRLIGNLSGGTVRFVLPASATARKLVLLNNENANIYSVTSLTQRNFVNYTLPVNQGNYVIISHSLLFNNGAGIDNVEKYRQYRASAAGGSYNAKTVDIDQLIDQFAFGIKHHPSSIRNFASFALANFTTVPKYFFLIGKGLDYIQFRYYESDINTPGMALIPPFGWPASDNLLTASRTGNTARIPIGRLSAISGTEVGDFLDKMKQFELAQVTNPQTIAGKGWMKNTAQITGAIDDPGLYSLISSYMDYYGQIMADTAMGSKVYSFSKNSGLYTAIGSTKTIDNIFSEGMSLLTYFGHSSPNTLEFNLDNPQNYNNSGKYPLIIVNGCNTGNLFLFDTLRPISKGTLSEKYVFTPQKGGIGFIADTHFGLPQQLNYFTYNFVSNLANNMYGQGIGDIMKTSMEQLNTDYSYDFIARCHSEEITFHGDPATRLNPHTLPDYTTQDSLITINPSVISVADQKITFTTKILNIGKAINDSLTVRFQHQLPDNSIVTLATRRIKATLYEDTLQVVINLNPLKHKGLNHFIVTIDPSGQIPELSETNNSVTKDFTVIEDEIRPVYPYNYAIVNSSANFAVYASTANPTAAEKQYTMEMDTSRNFNSPLKITKTVTDSGGIIKFLPGISLTDSTVYYWRVTSLPVTGSSRWLGSSFIYINGSYEGFDQAHYYQYTDDNFVTMNIDSSNRKFGFDTKTRKLLIRTGLYPYYDWDQININVDNDQLDQYGCKYASIQVAVYDPLTLKPWNNYNVTGTNGRFGSWYVCPAQGPTRNFFEFPYYDSVYRRRAMQFFDSIPTGYVVSISNLGWMNNASFVNEWKTDTTNLGSGKSLWHKFHSMALHKIDSFKTNLPFLFVFKKGDTTSYVPRQHVGATANEHIVDTFLLNGKNVEGSVETPWFGPAKAWQRFKWNDKFDQNSNNQKYFEITGKDINGNETLLRTVYSLKDTTISFISAAVYPYLKLRMYNTDPLEAKAAQLKYWMLTADEYPEGAVSPNITFLSKDTLNTTDTLHFKVSFKNVSKIAFDSIKVRLTVTDNAGVDHIYLNQVNGARLKPLIAGDSVVITYDIPTSIYTGQNQLFLDVNPDNDQPEQFHFNNVLYKNMFVVNPPCPGGSTSFSSGNTASGNTYQWQLNSGAGYANISNSSTYAGVTTSTLSINNAPTSMYGYRYRCVITNGSTVSYSNESILKFSLTWTGATNTSWATLTNWSCSVLPDANTDVIIKSGVPRFPSVNSNAICRTITLKTGATITIVTNFKLDIKGPPGN